ncbi:MAG: hypothetical protein ACXW4U_15345 [Anaerolineales bacterium]
MMTRSLYVKLVLISVLALVACSPVMPATEQATSIPNPTPDEPFHPFTMRTGVEEVDRVLEAVASGDQQALLSVIQFTEAKCTHAEGLGGPPKCQDGEVEGTPMEVLPFLGSEGSYLRKEELGNWQGIDVSALYAVYEVDSSRILVEEYFPAGEYVIVLIGTGNQSPVALRVTDGGIVRVDSLFEPIPETLDALIQREASNVILAPKN